MSLAFWAKFAVAVCVAAFAVTAEAQPSDAFPERLRAAKEQIPIVVLVPQEGLKVEYVPELTTRYTGARDDGLFGNIVARLLDQTRRKQLDKKAEPFGDSLATFDVAALAMDTTRQAFAVEAWLAKDNPVSWQDRLPVPLPATGLAAMTYEYAISPDHTRIFAGCSLRILVADAANASNSKRKWQEANLVYKSDNHASAEFVGLPKDKAARVAILQADQGAMLRQYIDEAMRTCAMLTVKRSRMEQTELDRRRSGKKVTVTTQRNYQIQGWPIEGAEALTQGSYGMLGIGKTFVERGANGVLLLEVATGGLFHHRVIQFTDR
ncbi:MAG: hypothetical protein ABL931_21960 [Usitatibacteraceae bacterium]